MIPWQLVARDAVAYPDPNTLRAVRRGLIQPYRHAFRGPPQGIGQGGVALGLGAGALVALILLAGIINYELGAAMAPTREKQSKWGWTNALLGTIFPPWTVGMAVYKVHFLD